MSRGYSIGKYFLLWFCFIILFVVSTITIELIEGSKITTSEYHGLKTIGAVYLFLTLAGGIIFYVITFLPLTLVSNWLIRLSSIRVILYIIAAIAGGLLLFVKQYGSYLLDGRGYGLNAWTACIVFGIAALLYGYMDHLLNKKIKAQIAQHNING